MENQEENNLSPIISFLLQIFVHSSFSFYINQTKFLILSITLFIENQEENNLSPINLYPFYFKSRKYSYTLLFHSTLIERNF